VLDGFPRPPQGDAALLRDALRAGSMVIDARPWEEYRRAHVQGTLNIPLDRSFTTWAGWLIPYDAAFYLITGAGGAAELAEAVRDLAMIGLDRIAGWFTADVIAEWSDAGGRLHRLEERAPADLRHAFTDAEITVLDIRGQSEWDAGHLPGVQNIPLGYLRERLDEVPRDRPIVVHCKSGSRSAIAASLLSAHGITNVINLAGGYDRWVAEGYPVADREPVPA
jgi:hydroxyacylglutathione hydrolase